MESASVAADDTTGRFNTPWRAVSTTSIPKRTRLRRCRPWTDADDLPLHTTGKPKTATPPAGQTRLSFKRPSGSIRIVFHRVAARPLKQLRLDDLASSQYSDMLAANYAAYQEQCARAEPTTQPSSPHNSVDRDPGCDSANPPQDAASVVTIDVDSDDEGMMPLLHPTVLLYMYI